MINFKKISVSVVIVSFLFTSQLFAHSDSKINTVPSLSVQLWSVKTSLKKDFEGTLISLTNMGFEGVEFAGDFGPYINDAIGLKQFLDGIHLKGSGAHIPFKLLNDEHFSKTVRFFQTLNVKTLIVPWDERAWHPEGVKDVVALLNKYNKQLSSYGMQVGFHNHDKEFTQFKQSTYWDYIATNTNKAVVLQQDVGWTTFAGKDPIEYVKKYPGRTYTTHYKVRLPKNTKGKHPFIGEDTIDWENLLKANINFGGTKWIVVEQEEYPDGISELDAVKRSKQGLDNFINQLK